MVQIPLYHRSRETGELITLDDHLAPLISRVHWSTGDVRRPQSPRHVSRLHGEPFTISLNRVIYALSHNGKLLDRDIFDSELGLLKHEMSRHPPLVFEDDNVLNCTLANIIPRALSGKGMRPRVNLQDLPLSPDGMTAFSTCPKQFVQADLSRVEEKVMEHFNPSNPRDVRDVDDLSKLFSHLDASSDPSIKRPNDTNKKGPSI